MYDQWQFVIDQKKLKKMAPFNYIIMTLMFHTAPECFYYQAFACTYDALEECHILCEETMLPDMIPHQRDQDSKLIVAKNLLWESKGGQEHISLTARFNQSNKTSQSQD